jgi:two-component system NarL family sensor kinase
VVGVKLKQSEPEYPSKLAALVPDAPGNQAGQVMETLAGGLLNRQDDEHRRLARILHDTTTQNLAALSMNLAMAAQEGDPQRVQAILAQCSSLTDLCLQEVRTLSGTLHPPLLDELGLESALRTFLDSYQRRTGIQVELQVSGGMGRLSRELELAGFRIAQQSLFNVEQHSGSENVRVELSRTRSQFEMLVRDWGKGPGAGAFGDDFSLGGMRERARLLGGLVEVRAANPGTEVRATF